MLEIISRAESGLPVPTTAAIETRRAHSLVLHHWGSFKPTTNARVRELRQLHLSRISSVGEAYNWLVGQDAPGKAWELRGRGRRPGGQRNVDGFDNNTGTRSIVVNGDYRSPGDPSGPIPASLIDTIAQLIVREHLAGDMPARVTHGHTNYVRPDGKGCCQSTSCPGVRLLAVIPVINARIDSLLEDDMTPEQEAKLDQALALLRAQPEAVWGGTTVTDPETGQEWHPKTFLVSYRKSLSRLTTAVGALDVEGVSEAELDVRVGELVAQIKAQPAAFVALLKSKL